MFLNILIFTTASCNWWFALNLHFISPRCRVHGDLFEGALFAPICVILFVNLLVFALTLRRLAKANSIRREQGGESTSYSRQKTTLQRSITFAILLGLTWITGLLMLDKDAIILQHIFSVLVSLQGFFLFLMQLLVPEVRQFWRRMLSRSPKEVANAKASLSMPAVIASTNRTSSCVTTTSIITLNRNNIVLLTE